MSCGIAEYNVWDSKQKNAVFFISPRQFPRKFCSVFSRESSKKKKATVRRGAGICPYNQDLLQTEEYK